jgi:hypothetical protein
MMRATCAACVWLGMAVYSGVALASVVSKPAACDALMHTAIKHHLVAKGVAPGRYDCAYDHQTDAYYVFGLHYRLDAPTDHAQSNLVGWYAVMKQGGAVYAWNVAGLTLGPLVDASP